MFSPILQAWRSWKSAKSVALLAVAALSIGIGSASAIYALVDAVLLRPLPYAHGERFAAIFNAERDSPGYSSVSFEDLKDYQKRTRVFDAFGIFQPRGFSLTSPGEPQHLEGVEVSPSFPAAFGISPILGHWFAGTDVNQAMISEALWKRLGGKPSIIGQPLAMSGRSYTVTGVMPADFHFPLSYVQGGLFRNDVWVPVDPQGTNKDRHVFSYFAYARVKPGVTHEQADADVKRVASELVKDYPKEHHARYTAKSENLKELVVKDIRPTLLLLFGAAGALLLLTWANVAGLLLSRAVSRSRETAIRAAVGASTGQLASQYLAEGLVLGMAGAAGGVALSVALVRLVLGMASDFLPRADGVGVNLSTVAFAVAAAFFSSVIFSLAPLWQALRIQPNQALGDGVRASASSASRSLSRWLVVGEIALAFALLALGALLATHLRTLLRTDPGFQAQNVTIFSLSVSEADYRKNQGNAAYQTRLLKAVEGIPGVTSAAISNQIPIEGCCFVARLFPDGYTGSLADLHEISFMAVSPHFFSTMGIRVFGGGLPAPGHEEEGGAVGIVLGRSAAKRWFPGRDAIGAAARFGRPNGDRARVTGVVGDVMNTGLGSESRPQMYFPATLAPVDPIRFVVRAPLAMAVLAPAIRQAVRSVNPEQPVYGFETMQEVLLGSLVRERLQSLLIAFFAVAASLMAGLGIYGVVSWSVRQRTVEIGTRMAMGAVSREIFRMVLLEGARMAMWGIALGAAGVAAITMLLRSQVFGVSVFDTPLPFLFAILLVGPFSGVACFVPAWRASLVSPMVAIRNDPASLWRTLSTRLSGLLQDSPEESSAMEGAVMTGFVETTRRAETFRQALDLSLANLAVALQSGSAQLLAREVDGQFLCVASTGGSVASVPAEGLLTGRLAHFPWPLPLTGSDLETQSRWAAAESPGHLAEIENLRESGAQLAVPLPGKKELSGILLLGMPKNRTQYSASEKNVLRNCAALFALMLENARLTDRIVEQEKLRRDVQLAVEVQKRLFPDKPPLSSAITLAGMSIPARSVGGDYYDFLDLGDQTIGIALADVAGKGIAAALVMSVVQASLRVLASEHGIALADLASRMNRYLHRSTGTNAYATFFYARFDGATRRLEYVNAGHNPPFLLRYSAGGGVEELPAGGTVIGLFPQMEYGEAHLDLQSGDVLIAFTDGVPEALSPADEEFGEDRIRDILQHSGHLAVDDLAALLASELKSWIADAAQYDDLTFVLMKVS